MKLIIVLGLVALLFISGCVPSYRYGCLEDISKKICDEENLTFHEVRFNELAGKGFYFNAECKQPIFDRKNPWSKIVDFYFTPEELKACEVEE